MFIVSLLPHRCLLLVQLSLFDCIWCPSCMEGSQSLSGSLSHAGSGQQHGKSLTMNMENATQVEPGPLTPLQDPRHLQATTPSAPPPHSNALVIPRMPNQKKDKMCEGNEYEYDLKSKMSIVKVGRNTIGK
jgi:hypothetical protein